MKIEFIGVSNPRQGYDFGPFKCDRCGSNTIAFLRLKMWKRSILLCKTCLGDGEDMINKTILADCKR